MNYKSRHALHAAILLSASGAVLSMPGCSLSPERRVEIIREESEDAEKRANRILKKALKQCRGDPVCEQEKQDEYEEAMRLIQKTRDSRIDGELEDAQESEDEWEEWFRELSEPAKKLWEPLIDAIRKLFDKEVKTEGSLTTSGLLELTTTDPNGQQGQSSQEETLTQNDAIGIASSLLSEPSSWEQVYRLQISGSVSMEFDGGASTTQTDAVFNLKGIYDGQLNPSETVGLTSGTVTLFGGEVTVRLSTAVGASQLRIHSNGNGYLLIAGHTEHTNEWFDTDLTDRVTVKIPVQLDGQNLVMTTAGSFVPGHLYFSQPDNLIADYDDDGYVNSFDLHAFLADYNNIDMYADINGDSTLDQNDVDEFTEEFNRSIAWTQFWSDWATP